MKSWINWKNVSIEDLNQRIKIALSTSKLVILNNERVKENDMVYLKESYLIIKKAKVFLIYYDSLLNIKKYVWAYIDKDRMEDDLFGYQAFNIFKRYVDVNTFKLNPNDFGFSSISEIAHSKAFQFYNKKYNFTKQIAYEYDLNSAYTSMCCSKMPTVLLRKDDYLKDIKTEVGFNEVDGYLSFVENDFEICDFVFKLERIKGFTEFFLSYYEKKKKAKLKGNKRKSQYYKNIMNYVIGYLQKINPFVKAYIILNLNKKMFNYVDKYYDDILLSNVDSLISKRDLSNVLPISNNLGDFKEVRKGEDFYMYGYNYQWNFEPPSYRGIPKAWFENYQEIMKKEFDLSKTSVNTLNVLYNKYRFNYKLNQFVKEIG